MPHNIHEADYSHNSYYNVSDDKVVHNSSDFNNLTLPMKRINANTEPVINTGILTLPENPGMKNPTTDEANNILDKSAKNFEIDSIWGLLNLNGIYIF